MTLKVTSILKEVRKKHKLTQEEFAQKLGVSRSAIAQIENGKNNISTDLAKKISEIFSVSLDVLLGGVEYIENTSLKRKDGKEKFEDTIYFRMSLLELDIDKTNILKNIIKKFAEEKKMRGVTPAYDSYTKQSNYIESIQEYKEKSSKGAPLTEDFISEVHKKVNFAIECLFADLYGNLAYAYNAIEEHYKKYK